MRKLLLGVAVAVILVIAAVIGWPREGGPVDPTAGVTTPQDDFGNSEGTADGSVGDQDWAPATGPVDEPVDGQPAAGDPAVEVTGEPEFDETAPSKPVEATWDDTVRTAALDAARATMTAFAATDQTATAWWDGLEPLLTPQARPIYQDVDPRLVPVTEVTGDPEVTDETSSLLAEVAVPTDIGPYTVLLTRVDGAAPWLAEQIRPPEGS